MNLFNKLSGFQRSPAGLEWRIWKKLHIFLFAGTALPLLAAATVYAADWLWPNAQPNNKPDLFLYIMLGLITLDWTLVLALAIGCAIVIIMKGPAYIADAYALEQSEDFPKA
jgi:hypothetical protein